MSEYPNTEIPRYTEQKNTNKIPLMAICDINTYYTNILMPITEAYVLGKVPEEVFETALCKYIIALGK